MTPAEIVITVVACLCAAMTGTKLRDLAANPGNRALRLICVSLAAVTLATVLQPLAPGLDRWDGRLDTTRVAADCLVLIAAECGRSAFLYVSHQDRQVHRVLRRRAAALLGCLAAIVILFVLTPAHHGLNDADVRSHAYYAATPPPLAAPYILVFLAYLTWCAAGSLAQTARYARHAPTGLLRVGLSLLASGALVTFGYVLVKIAASIAHASAAPWAGPLDTAVGVAYGLASALVLLGATISSWGPRIGLVSAWTGFAARRDCRRLTPLWNLVHSGAPEVTLLPHPRQPTLRRLRMTVEILDGCAQLSRWAPARPAPAGTTGNTAAATEHTAAGHTAAAAGHTAAGHTAAAAGHTAAGHTAAAAGHTAAGHTAAAAGHTAAGHTAAAVEAALIRAAVDARLHGPAGGIDAGTRLCPPENREAAAEVAWLSRISAAVRRQRDPTPVVVVTRPANDPYARP